MARPMIAGRHLSASKQGEGAGPSVRVRCTGARRDASGGHEGREPQIWPELLTIQMRLPLSPAMGANLWLCRNPRVTRCAAPQM